MSSGEFQVYYCFGMVLFLALSSFLSCMLQSVLSQKLTGLPGGLFLCSSIFSHILSCKFYLPWPPGLSALSPQLSETAELCGILPHTALSHAAPRPGNCFPGVSCRNHRDNFTCFLFAGIAVLSCLLSAVEKLLLNILCFSSCLR